MIPDSPTPATAPEAPPADNPQLATPAPARPAAAPPPAALVVVEGERTEREIELERRLAESESRLKRAQTDAAYAQDEARRLKEVQSAPAPAPAARKGRGGLRGWCLADMEAAENEGED